MNAIELVYDEFRVYIHYWAVNCQNKQFKNTSDSR